MLQTLLQNYQPFDTHERAMTERLRAFLGEAATADAFFADAFGRELAGSEPHWGHVTGSAWVVDETLGRTVLVHHAKLGKWVQPGGHCEGETDVLAVAKREAEEETSLVVAPMTTEIFDIDVHEIPEYWRTPAHNHYDVRFLLRANSSQQPQTSDESHAVRWFSLDEALEISGEESVARMVEKTRRLAASRLAQQVATQ